MLIPGGGGQDGPKLILGLLENGIPGLDVFVLHLSPVLGVPSEDLHVSLLHGLLVELFVGLNVLCCVQLVFDDEDVRS